MAAFKNLKKQYMRLDREVHDLEFLKLCRDMGLIPKFLSSRSKFLSNSFPKEKYLFENKCLKSFIRIKYGLVDRVTKKIYGVKNNGFYQDLVQSCSQTCSCSCSNPISCSCSHKDFDLAMKKICKFRQSLDSDLQKRLSNKINSLLKIQGHVFPRRNVQDQGFVNLSSRTFTEREERLLSKGPKHICFSRPKKIDLIPEFEDIVRNIDETKREEARNFIFLKYKRFSRTLDNIPLTDLKLAKHLKEMDDLVFLSTDKSGRIAIMDRDDYISKMKDSISALKAVQIQGDPLPSFLNKTTKLVKNNFWPNEVKKEVKVNALGVIPSLFAVVKDHKPSNPLRPIVPRCNAPSYFVEKVLVNILKEILPPSNKVLTSTKDFITKLEQFVLPNTFILASLDVVSLFPSIDTAKARDNIQAALDNNSTFSPDFKTTIIAAVNLVISHNYFMFNGVIYQQNVGAPIGSPISGILAEFILRPMEDSFLSNTSFPPIAWLRYVDDIFVIWPFSTIDFLDFANQLNSLDPAIQFTWEFEKNDCLPFLDVLLKKENNKIIRSVYRKPMNSLSTIPSSAIAPVFYKQAAFRSFIHRAVLVCSQETIHEEFDIIRSIAIDNGYSLHSINNLILRILRPISMANSSSQPTRLPKRIPITYLPGFHESLNRFLKSYNVSIVARTFPKLKNFLRTRIDPFPLDSRPGVYEIPFSVQGGPRRFYIGLTSRKLHIRLKEHESTIRLCKLTTALARTYFEDPTTQIYFNEARIVAPFTSYVRAAMRESLEIFTRKQVVCNEQDSFRIPPLWLALL